MHPASLPVEVLGAFNTARLCPAAATEPFVQAVYARHSGTEGYTDLLHGALDFHAGSLTEQTSLYLQVNWNGRSGGRLYLSQTLDPADGMEVEEGLSDAESLSLRPKEVGDLYLLVVYDGEVEAVKLGAAALSEGVEVDLNLGESFDVATPVSDNFLSQFEFAVELPKDIKVTMKGKNDGTVEALLGVELSKEKEDDTAFDTVRDALDYAKQKDGKLDCATCWRAGGRA